jgi:hypothetical protein
VRGLEETMNDTFIRLPNITVWDSERINVTLIKQYGDKILPILCYLDVNINRLGNIKFTLKDMIETYGLTLKSGSDGNNNQFITILDSLKAEGIITNIKGIYNKPTELVTCNMDLPVGDKYWFPIYHEHYIKILNSTFDRLILLKIYAYISARLKRSTKIEGITTEPIVECMYESQDIFCKDLDITDVTLNKHLVHLKELGILYYDNIGMVKDISTHEANNVYCFDKEMLPKALDNSKVFYLARGYEILGKKTANEIKKLNGLNGKKVQEKNAGKDTTKLDKKISKLEKSRKSKNVIPQVENKEIIVEEADFSPYMNPEDLVEDVVEEILNPHEKVRTITHVYTETPRRKEWEEDMPNYPNCYEHEKMFSWED